MFFNLPYTVLLASLVAILSWQDAFTDAAPVKRDAFIISLPLRRVEARSGVHPQVMYQQHANRAHMRFARMTGRQEPSISELESNLVKRILWAGEAEVTKRYNRVGTGRISERFDRHGIHGLYSFKDLEGAEGLDNIISPRKVTANSSSGTEPSTGGNDDVPAPDPQRLATAQGLTKADKPSAPNSLGLDIEANDVGYVATVQIGTPPQDFSILMDSGSADLWVGAEGCLSQGGGDCGKHRLLGKTSSSSFKQPKVDQPFDIKYGTGEVSGIIIADNINIAGLQLVGHQFGVATKESVDFSSDSTSFDGLMGLAQSTLSEQRTLTPVEALAKGGLIQDAITSYKISRLEDGKNDGVITFGGLDNSKFDAKTLTTLKNVNENGFWEADMPAVTVDGKDSRLQARTAILDTGTTLIVAPPQDAKAVHALIPGAKSDGQGGFTVPCNSKTIVSLKFGKNLFSIDPRDLAFAPLSNDPQGDCLSGISSGAIGGPNQWLVGDVFLKSAYFSTDVTKNQLSLAKLV